MTQKIARKVRLLRALILETVQVSGIGICCCVSYLFGIRLYPVWEYCQNRVLWWQTILSSQANALTGSFLSKELGWIAHILLYLCYKIPFTSSRTGKVCWYGSLQRAQFSTTWWQLKCTWSISCKFVFRFQQHCTVLWIGRWKCSLDFAELSGQCSAHGSWALRVRPMLSQLRRVLYTV